MIFTARNRAVYGGSLFLALALTVAAPQSVDAIVLNPGAANQTALANETMTMFGPYSGSINAFNDETDDATIVILPQQSGFLSYEITKLQLTGGGVIDNGGQIRVILREEENGGFGDPIRLNAYEIRPLPFGVSAMANIPISAGNRYVVSLQFFAPNNTPSNAQIDYEGFKATAVTPIPAAGVLLLSGLAGLVGLHRAKRRKIAAV